MNALLHPAVIGLLVFCILAEIAYQVSFKLGAGRAGRDGGPLVGVAVQPLVWLGIVIWSVEAVVWVLVLQRAPLSLAYPVMTLNYAAVPLAGVILLRERLSRSQIAGAARGAAGGGCNGRSGL